MRDAAFGIACLLAAAAASGQGLPSLQGGHWMEVASSRLDAVKPDPLPNG